MTEGDPPTAGLTAADVEAMSPQQTDELRRRIADYHDVHPEDVQICTCGTVHVHRIRHLICPANDTHRRSHHHDPKQRDPD